MRKECSESICQVGNLKTHMRTNSREKPFVCKECTNSFSRADSLTIHMITQSGEKPFKECQCNSVLRVGNLKTHMITHSGEKPFLCKECTNSFSRADSLTIHTRTNSIPFKECQFFILHEVHTLHLVHQG